MAIKITKPGQKEFHGFCKWCGCEFTYEISDLKLSATSDKVSCPTCGKDYHHPSMVQDPTIPGGIGYGRLQDTTWPPSTVEPIPCVPDLNKTDPCEGCAWREKLLRDGLYIGDIPCTWCNKNKFSSICGGTVASTGACPEAYLNSCTTSSSECEVGSTYTINNSDVVDSLYVDKKLQEVYNSAGCNTLNKHACGSCDACGSTEGQNSCSSDHECSGKKNCKGKH
jgi:hypothetical protein